MLNLIRLALALTLLAGSTAGAFEDAGTTTDARFAYRCASALVKLPAVEAGFEPHLSQLIRAAKGFRGFDGALKHNELKQLRRQVQNGGGRLIAMGEAVGADAIRKTIADARDLANMFESEHQGGTTPFPYASKFWDHVGAATAGAGLTAIWMYLAYSTGQVFHPIFALAPMAVSYVAFSTFVTPHVTMAIDDLRSGAQLKGRLGGLTSKSYSSRELDAVLSSIEELLNAEKLPLDVPMVEAIYVPLPMSRSTAAFWAADRQPPTIQDIITSVRVSGDFVTPADARWLQVTYVYARDAVRGDTLKIFGREYNP